MVAAFLNKAKSRFLHICLPAPIVYNLKQTTYSAQTLKLPRRGTVTSSKCHSVNIDALCLKVLNIDSM